jgi:hypothetical protein
MDAATPLLHNTQGARMRESGTELSVDADAPVKAFGL